MDYRMMARELHCSEATVRKYVREFSMDYPVTREKFDRMKEKLGSLGSGQTVGRPYGSYSM